MNRSNETRRATLRDAAVLARLSRELGYPVTAGEMRRRLRAILNSPADLVIVATGSRDRVVGWLQAHASCVVESGFRVEITGLVVSAKARRRGVGRSLVRAAEHWAAGLSAQTVVVRSNASRVESHSFYPALGYATAKTQVVYRKLLGRLARGGNAHPRWNVP